MDRGRERLRIAYVTDGWAHAGGAEPLLYALVTGLDRSRFEPVVCTVFGSGRDGYCRLAREAGIPLYHFPMSRSDAVCTARSATGLVSFLHHAKIDIVHGSLDRGIGVLAGWLARVPVRTLTVHLVDPKRPPLDEAFNRLVMNRFIGRTIAISRSIATEVAHSYGVSPRKIDVILNGTDEDRLRHGAPITRHDIGTSEKTGILLFAGRLVPQKGCDVALAATALAIARCPDVNLIVAGDGPLRPELEAGARALGIAHRVRFVGYQVHLGPWLRLADLVVMPSYWEGLGMTAIEAMALARPVVGSNVGGLAEVVVHRETGLLPSPTTWMMSAPRLDPGAFADAILEVLNDPARARAMGEAGRRRYERLFSSAAFLARHEQFYVREAAAAGIIPPGSL